MKYIKQIFISCFLLLIVSSIYSQQYKEVSARIVYPSDLKAGAERTKLYFSKLKGKNIAVVANQTSKIKNTLLVDSLLKAGFKI